MAAARPVSGAPIESAWGDQVHDAVVVGRGVIVTGATNTGAGASAKIPIDAVAAGDAGLVNLGTDELIPTLAGLWELSGYVNLGGYTGAGAGAAYRVSITVNGAIVHAFSAPTYSANGVSGGYHVLLQLAAGDKVAVNTAGPPAGGTANFGRAVFVLRAQALG